MNRTSKEYSLALQQERTIRREGDSLFTWEPFEKQEIFIDSVICWRKIENWFIAANRSGKSDAGAYIGSTLARFGNDNARYSTAKGSKISIKDRATSGWVVSLDFPSSRDIIQPKYFDNGFVAPGSSHEPFIPAREIADWRISDQILKLKNGSIIGFKSCDSKRIKFQGTEKDWLHFDEEPPRPIYEECRIRIGTRPLRLFGTCTLLPPEGMVGGVSWLFEDIIQPVLDGVKSDIVGLFGASIYDNPHLPESEIKVLESVYTPGSTQYRIRLGGEWLPGLNGARAYTNFDSRIHVRPQPEIKPRQPLCWIWDFNVEPMVTTVGQRDPELYRIHKELYLDEGSIPDMCDLFKNEYPHHGSEVWVYGDATSERRNSQTGRTDYWTIANEMKSYGVPVRFKIPTSNPHVADRVNAVNRILRDEYGQVRFEMDPSCKELKADFEGVLRDPKGTGIKKTTKRNDPYFKRTHSSDGVGYWLWREDPVKIGKRSNGSRRSRRKKLPTVNYGFSKHARSG